VNTERLRLSMQRAIGFEIAVCELLNRRSQPHQVKKFFVVISWLGDGKAWYCLMFVLPLMYGEGGFATAWSMAKIGVVNLLIYKLTKQLTGRQRPCAVSANIDLGIAPLDQYSFPSGHTMHAVAFSMIATFLTGYRCYANHRSSFCSRFVCTPLSDFRLRHPARFYFRRQNLIFWE
jgi:undecaprenyl-diphosphatase